MLSKEDDENIYVEAYSTLGFKLSSGFRIIGPCILFPRSILHWGVSKVSFFFFFFYCLFNECEFK